MVEEASPTLLANEDTKSYGMDYYSMPMLSESLKIEDEVSD